MSEKWGAVFNRHKARGCDPSDAAHRADQWEKRRQKTETINDTGDLLEALKALDEQLDFSVPYSDDKPWIFSDGTDLNAAFELARAALRARR